MDIAQVLGQPADIGVLAPQGVDPPSFGPGRRLPAFPFLLQLFPGRLPLGLPPARQALSAHRGRRQHEQRNGRNDQAKLDHDLTSPIRIHCAIAASASSGRITVTGPTPRWCISASKCWSRASQVVTRPLSHVCTT